MAFKPYPVLGSVDEEFCLNKYITETKLLIRVDWKRFRMRSIVRKTYKGHVVNRKRGSKGTDYTIVILIRGSFNF